MGQKVSPVGMRVGVNRAWDSSWYDDKNFSKYLNEDIQIRKYLEKECDEALISRIEITRIKNDVKVVLWCAKPGIVLGQDSANVEKITKQLTKLVAGKKVNFTVEEVKNPNLDAQIVAKQMAKQLEARASFRMVQKKAIQQVMKSGAKGIKTSISGRLGGADIARAEGYSEGVISLHTLRQDIDFAIAEASTTYGKLGVKVWISRGEILPERKAPVEKEGE